MRRDPTFTELRLSGQLPGRNHLIALVALVILVVGVTCLDQVGTSYIYVEPGTVHDVSDVVVVTGTAPPVPAEGRGAISLVTVRTGTASIADHIYALFRRDVQLIPERNDPADRRGQRDRSADLMAESRQAAKFAALRWLGYNPTVRGDGVRIDEIVTDSAAPGVLEVGDEILRVDGITVTMASEIRRVLESKKPGEVATVDVIRNGQEYSLAVSLSPAGDDGERAILGIIASTIRLEFVYPVEVGIETGNIGGPSAGLPLALGVVDAFTPGSLSGDKSVVATGDIRLDGKVGAVGGVREKAIAASRSNARYFLVPEANLAEAVEGAEGVEVIPVTDLDQAIRVLERLRGVPIEVPEPSTSTAVPATG